MPAGSFNAEQLALLRTAQSIFIFEQLIIFPLYYLPGLRGLLGGDSKDAIKFPCSISWMTRKGLPRLVTLVLWNFGWFCFARAFFKDGDFAAMTWPTDWLRAAFMLQMYATGFVTVVLTPMQGPDVALGPRDALHCYCAMAYVFDHWIANEFVLGVHMGSAFGIGFILTSVLCGVCQCLRANDDRLALQLYVRLIGSKRMSLVCFTWILELGFMLFENALFLIFLFGMASGVHVTEG